MAARTSVSSTTPIEFKVVPTEDLFLGGSLKKVPRVVKGLNFKQAFLISILLR